MSQFYWFDYEYPKLAFDKMRELDIPTDEITYTYMIWAAINKRRHKALLQLIVESSVTGACLDSHTYTRLMEYFHDNENKFNITGLQYIYTLA